MNIENKSMSQKFFRNICEQLIFDNKFNEIDVSTELSKFKLNIYVNIAVIYGLRLEYDTLQLGKYLLINKRNIVEYIRENIDKKNNENHYEHLEENFGVDENEDTDYVFVILENQARDRKFAHDLFIEDKKTFINIVRYMLGLKDERLGIDLIKNEAYKTEIIQISLKKLFHGTDIKTKDRIIQIDHPFFTLEENGNKKIWNLLEIDTITHMEKRILKAINWCAISINETNNEIACTELVFAFEALLKQSESGGPTTSSIQGQISEMVAFLIGNSLDERKVLVRKFKEFYAYRSAIAHGGSKTKEMNYYEYLEILKETIITLLTDSQFSVCKNIDELIEKVNDIKYSTAPTSKKSE